jgi:hypothetical protein
VQIERLRIRRHRRIVLLADLIADAALRTLRAHADTNR